jgi:hypothetical protein
MNTPKQAVVDVQKICERMDWHKLLPYFHSELTLDYSSLTGYPSAKVTAKELVDLWISCYSQFDYTTEKLDHFVIKEENNEANVYCHMRKECFKRDEENNVWGAVGTYDIDLIKVKHQWKIRSLKFILKYQWGNLDLPLPAVDAIKSTSK